MLNKNLVIFLKKLVEITAEISYNTIKQKIVCKT